MLSSFIIFNRRGEICIYRGQDDFRDCNHFGSRLTTISCLKYDATNRELVNPRCKENRSVFQYTIGRRWTASDTNKNISKYRKFADFFSAINLLGLSWPQPGWPTLQHPPIAYRSVEQAGRGTPGGYHGWDICQLRWDNLVVRQRLWRSMESRDARED
jgi:hypothetical protein